MNDTTEYKCTTCHDTGYVTLPGFPDKMREFLTGRLDPARLEKLSSLSCTAYKCAFCNTEKKERT